MENINFNKIKKILIIGGTGMGKSTLADNIGKQLDLPICHIDAIHFKENWIERDVKERDEIIRRKINEPKWILDGLYKSTLKESIEKADLVVILWFSKLTQLKGIIKRHLKNYGKERNDIPGCVDKLDVKFIRFTLDFKKKNKSIIENILRENNKNKILIFKKQKQLNKWYENNFKTKIC